MTAPTPMMMPSIVRTLRSLFTRSALTAMRALTQTFTPSRARRPSSVHVDGRRARDGVNVWVSARIAVRALRVNKLRSVLTMLGIIIGVGAVITMVGVGAGAQARVAEEIRSLGSNLIIVLAGTVTSGGVRLGTGSK